MKKNKQNAFQLGGWGGMLNQCSSLLRKRRKRPISKRRRRLGKKEIRENI